MSDPVFISLPWPDSRLNPNGRLHWAKKSPITKKARHLAQACALEGGLRSVADPKIKVTVTLVPPDKRRRDFDNAIASCKAYCDGIADVIGVDDSRWDLTFKQSEPKAPGSVLIEVERPA